VHEVCARVALLLDVGRCAKHGLFVGLFYILSVLPFREITLSVTSLSTIVKLYRIESFY